MTILALLETCTVGSNTVVLTDRLDLPDRRITSPICALNAPEM
jgi:hypothetical protein